MSSKESIDFSKMPGPELLEYISFKEEFHEVAEKAFVQFCFRYQDIVKKYSERYCDKFNYNEVTALEIANCTFRRVWKYPSFDLNKAKSKDPDTAIAKWLRTIVWTRVMTYGSKGYCSEPQELEDLEIVENLDSYIEKSGITDLESKRELKAKLSTIERALESLSEKHRIIYFTYKAYERNGKKLPRSLTDMLRKKLGLTQKSINTYQGQAERQIEMYLSFINGNS